MYCCRTALLRPELSETDAMLLACEPERGLASAQTHGQKAPMRSNERRPAPERTSADGVRLLFAELRVSQLTEHN
ncbi:hypothetical protein EYF80_047965 [Liparis tanakae]|uniref:Uncharacterized protein n=1 Tax=Liparis tanakae TaxID=230148 RepID=A0A4Z2FL48_9TELE|nr:hypothetical protein EYF80_047965 [Liparis tanakae]